MCARSSSGIVGRRRRLVIFDRRQKPTWNMKEIVSTPTDSFPSSAGGFLSLAFSFSVIARLSLPLLSLSFSPSLSCLYILAAVAPSLSRLLSLYREIGGRRGAPGARGGSFPPVTEELRVPLNMHESSGSYLPS